MDRLWKGLLRSLGGFLVGMVALAATIRLTWELLKPALVPVGIIVAVVFALFIIGRLIWHRTDRF